jgi:hypothetical protein
MVGLTAALALDVVAWLMVVAGAAVAAVAELARPTPSNVPAMARDAPAAASLGAVSLGTVEIRMKWCLPLVNALVVRPQGAAGISSADGDPWHVDKPAPGAQRGT